MAGEFWMHGVCGKCRAWIYRAFQAKSQAELPETYKEKCSECGATVVLK